MTAMQHRRFAGRVDAGDGIVILGPAAGALS